MTFYQYIQKISAPRLAVILGYIADSNPRDMDWNEDACCPLKGLGQCVYGTFDCCESWAVYLLREMTEQDRRFWETIYKENVLRTQAIIDQKRKEEAMV